MHIDKKKHTLEKVNLTVYQQSTNYCYHFFLYLLIMGLNDWKPTFLDAPFSEVAYDNISSKAVLESAISDFKTL